MFLMKTHYAEEPQTKQCKEEKKISNIWSLQMLWEMTAKTSPSNLLPSEVRKEAAKEEASCLCFLRFNDIRCDFYDTEK